MQPAVIYPDCHLGLIGSVAGAYGVGLLVPLVLLAILLRRYLGARRRARSAVELSVSGETGVAGEVVVDGKVAFAAGASAAVRVEVTQQGSEQLVSNKWQHAWSEQSRTVVAEPFYLERPGGGRQKLRIEPPENVMLLDELDGVRVLDGTTRLRWAELTEGEVIFASGQLQHGHDPEAGAGYRGEGQALVLRPPARGRMVLSKEPLEARFRVDAKVFRGWAIAVVLLTLAFQAALLPFHARLWAGETVTAHLVNKRFYVEEGSEGKTDERWEVSVWLPENYAYTDLVDEDDYERLTLHQPLQVRRVRGRQGFEQLGASASLDGASIGTGLVFGLLVFGAYRIHQAMRRRWTDEKVVDRGGGRLPEGADAERGT